MTTAPIPFRSQNPLLDAALAYAALGWPVFPCRPQEKEPATPHGFKDASCDPVTIREWWRRWPRANVATPTGGKLALDVDQPGGPAWLVQQPASIAPSTVTNLTGGGGEQRLYSRSAGGHIPNSAGKIAPDIDVKADGGYILLPPSIHPNGTPYRWQEGASPWERDLTPAPDALIALATTPPRRPPRPLSATPNAPREIHKGLVRYALAGMGEGERNSGGYWLACRLLDQVTGGQADLWDARRLFDSYGAACRPALSSSELDKIWGSAEQADRRAISDWSPSDKAPIPPTTPPAAPPDTDLDTRPIIRVDRPVDEVVAAFIATFHAANGDRPILFQQGRALVRVVDSHAGGVSIPIMEVLTIDSLRLAVGEIAQLVRWVASKKRDIETDASRDQLAAVLTAPVWPFPVLEGISEVPIIRPDGTVHDTPGYDSATRQMYHPAPGVTVAPVPAHPTADQQAAARALIVDELLGDFPFTGDAERAHAVALLLLPFARPLIAGPTPIHLVESPTPGTGKSLLVKAALTPALGNRLEGGQDKRDDDEMRKWITTRLQAGAPALWMDNIKTGLDSATLANATTQEMWEDRLLGSNTAFRAPVRCVWVATANNPVLSTEMARRVLRIRLDAGVDQPQFRTDFRHRDILAWGVANRAALIHAALVLVRAWVAAGRPAGGQPFGSYQHYADVMGGILVTAGISGFLQNAAEVYEVSDVESARWRTLVVAWYERYESRPILSKDLLDLVATVEGFDYSGPGGTRQFGIDLAKQRDRIYSGYRIAQLPKKYHNAWQWALIPQGGGQAPDPNTSVVVDTSDFIPTHEQNEDPPDQFAIRTGEKLLVNTTTLVFAPDYPCADCGATDWYPHTPDQWRCHKCGSFPPTEDM